MSLIPVLESKNNKLPANGNVIAFSEHNCQNKALTSLDTCIIEYTFIYKKSI